jgi:hypothetical protein
VCDAKKGAVYNVDAEDAALLKADATHLVSELNKDELPKRVRYCFCDL